MAGTAPTSNTPRTPPPTPAPTAPNAFGAKYSADHEFQVLQLLRPGQPIPHAKPIRGKLWELKLGDNRLFYCTYIGCRLVILHGYRKKGQRAPRQEIETAEQRMADFFDREARKQ